MKLENKIIVLAGGTGEVGEGMAKVFLQEGATVIVPVRSLEKEQKLKDYLARVPIGKLVTLHAQVGEEKEAKRFKQKILDQFGRIDIAIASLGGWYQGYDLADMPADLWFTLMNNNLTSHFIFARTFIPVLRTQNEGLYININGGAQDFIIPKAGGMTIISAAQNRMTEVFNEEAKGKGYKVRSVAAYSPVKTRSRGNQVQSHWVGAEDMGHYIVKLYRKETPEDPVTHKLKSSND